MIWTMKLLMVTQGSRYVLVTLLGITSGFSFQKLGNYGTIGQFCANW